MGRAEHRSKNDANPFHSTRERDCRSSQCEFVAQPPSGGDSYGGEFGDRKESAQPMRHALRRATFSDLEMSCICGWAESQPQKLDHASAFGRAVRMFLTSLECRFFVRLDDDPAVTGVFGLNRFTAAPPDKRFQRHVGSDSRFQ